MMKYLLLLSLVVIAIDSLYGLKACTDNSKCEEDECCTSMSILSLLGHCKKRGKAGEKCNVNNKERLSKYHLTCPCGEGLECKPEKDGFIGKIWPGECKPTEDGSDETPEPPEEEEY